MSESRSDPPLLLAAEEIQDDEFEDLHYFSKHDGRIINKLMASGPVLLRGGRGTGKSALLIEAYRRMCQLESERVLCVYASLRHYPLLVNDGEAYHFHFCSWVSRKIQYEIAKRSIDDEFPNCTDVEGLRQNLHDLAGLLRIRVVLLFDDAAHIGRDKSLSDFFDIFRSLSMARVSCKASIYPGVTQFGDRFDVYNDATVVDILRDERIGDFGPFFEGVLRKRYRTLADASKLSEGLSVDKFARLLGRAVLGNMRAFIFACNRFEAHDRINLQVIGDSFQSLASDYFWPLIEEVAPKLGRYQPIVNASRQIGEKIFGHAVGRDGREGVRTKILLHRDLVQRYQKALEILEYAGFISQREASRAMKSKGRGRVYALNLCNLFEVMANSRMTYDLMDQFINAQSDPAEIHLTSRTLEDVEMPDSHEVGDLSVLNLSVERLNRSNAYPYGLTNDKIKTLAEGGFQTVGAIVRASDEDLLCLPNIGQKWVNRIRDVVYQAVWM